MNADKRDNTQSIDSQRAALKRMSDIIEAVGVGVWELDIPSGRLTFDDTMYKLYGVTRAEFPDPMDVNRRGIHPEDRQRMREGIFERISSGESTFDITFRVVHPGGQIRHLRVKATVEKGEHGEPLKIFGADFDVTDTVLAEEQRVAAAEKLAKILDAASVGTWEWDLRTQVVEWDDGMFKLFGLTREEFNGTPEAFAGIVHPEDRQLSWQKLEKILAGPGTSFETRFRAMLPDGQIRYCSGTYAVERDADGKPIKMSGINLDITRSTLAEMEKAAAAKKLASILDAVAVGTWECDLEKKTLEFDDPMYRLYGIKKGEFADLFEAAGQVIHPDDLARLQATAQRCIADGRSNFQEEFRVILRDGSVRHLSVKTTIERDATGVPIRMSGVDYDVTSLVEAAEEKQRTLETLEIERMKSLRNARLASLGEMAAGIAHEINNPLTIIMGTALLLRNEDSDAREVRFSKLDTIDKATSRIAKIVSSLRKFSRSDDKSDYKEHELADIIKEAIILTDAKSRRHSVPVTVRTHGIGKVICDEIEIEQVLVNLINNAIDAVTDRDEKWVHIELSETDRSVIVQIRDSGRGIDPDIQKKLFQPFFTTKPVGQGTGLGLSIVKGIMDEHKATVDLLASDPHTCFELNFPKAGVNQNVI